MDQQHAKLLVAACRESMSRSRFLMTTVLIVSVLYLMTSYNLYFSWLRTITDASAFSTDPVVAVGQRELIKGWVSTTFIDLPIVGMRIHVTDVSLV